MEESDIEFGLNLGQMAGWNQLFADWKRFRDYQPDGCFLATINDRAVGTITSTCYGTDLAWIGMMLVHPEFRRRGIATALMTHVIRWLQDSGVRCIKLDATPAGAKVYEQLGFQSEWDFHRHQLQKTPADKSAITSETMIHGSLVDREAFGVDRSRLLETFSRDSSVIGDADGFGMIRPGRLASYLGPVVCQSEEVATSLIDSLLAPVTGMVFWDVPGPNSSAKSIALQLGFTQARQLTRMWQGENLVSGRVDWQYALASPATG